MNTLLSCGQVKNSTLSKQIIWFPNCLTFKDFKANGPNLRLDSNPSLDAGTYYRTNFRYNVYLDTIFVKINSVFYCDSSWMRKSLLGDTRLLKHEQTHFDLGEIYARKFAEKLSAFYFTENYKEEINKIAENIEQEAKEQQTLYDQETDHSKNWDEQDKWNSKIIIGLKLSNPIENIKLKLLINKKG